MLDFLFLDTQSQNPGVPGTLPPTKAIIHQFIHNSYPLQGPNFSHGTEVCKWDPLLTLPCPCSTILARRNCHFRTKDCWPDELGADETTMPHPPASCVTFSHLRWQIVALPRQDKAEVHGDVQGLPTTSGLGLLVPLTLRLVERARKGCWSAQAKSP